MDASTVGNKVALFWVIMPSLPSMQALHTRVKRSKTGATTRSRHDDFHLKLPKTHEHSSTSAPLLYHGESDALSFSARGHTTPIFTPDTRELSLTRPGSRPGSGSRSASRSGSRGSNVSRPNSRSGVSGEFDGEEYGDPSGSLAARFSLSTGPAGSRLDGPDGSSHGTILSEDCLPGIPENNDTQLRHGVPGAVDDGVDNDGSQLAPCSSSEVWLSTSEDLEDLSSMSAFSALSSEGKSPHASNDGEVPLDGDCNSSQRNRAPLPTGPLPTVAEEPGGEDVTSPSVSQGSSSSSDGRVFSAPRTVSLSSTPQGFGSTLTGSMHSGTSPLQSFPTGSIGPTSMDSGELQHLSPKDSIKTADLNVFPSEALEELTTKVDEHTSNSPHSDATYVSCKSSNNQKAVSTGSNTVSGDESSLPDLVPSKGQLSIACEDLEPPTVYASIDETSTMSSVTAEPLEARAAGASANTRSVVSGAGSVLPLPTETTTSINWLYNPCSTASASCSTIRDSVSDSVTSAMLLGSIHKVQKGEKSQPVVTQIPESALSGPPAVTSGASAPSSPPTASESQQQQQQHQQQQQQQQQLLAAISAPPSPPSPSAGQSPAAAYESNSSSSHYTTGGSTHRGRSPEGTAENSDFPRLALTCPHTVTTGMGEEAGSRGALYPEDLVCASPTTAAEAAASAVQQHAMQLDVNRMAIAPESGRSNASGTECVDTLSDLSMILDSSGNQAVCLRNQPRLPKTAFLSSTPSMLAQYMGSDGPLSTHTTPRSIGDIIGLMAASPGGSIIRGSSAFDSALRSDDDPSAQVCFD